MFIELQCSALDALLPGKVEFPGTDAYDAAQELYFSDLQTDVAPACRLAPASSEDVSTIVSTAVQLKCKFAIHSGGHMMPARQSNIGYEGFTIDTAGLNTFELSEDESQVTLGPGNTWGPVYDALNQRNLTVVGARAPSVGVGGYLLGGTRSFSVLIIMGH